ncbi:MAG: Xaa-Pro peptidase family protein [Bacteroidota bacterium]
MQESARYHRRIAALRNEFRSLKLDAFMTSALPTMQYLCGYSGSNGLLIVDNRSTHFFTDFRYQEYIQSAVTADAKIIGKGSLAQVAAKKGLFSSFKKIAIEQDRMTLAEFVFLKKIISPGKFVLTSGIVEQLRVVKDHWETVALKRAFAISDRVFHQLLGVIKPGMNELEISAEISSLHKKNGAENDAFDVIVASGVRGSLPHGTATEKKIHPGEFITLDFGCIFGGYHSDMTRTICVGKPSAEMKKVYRTVLESQQKACDAVRSGIPAKSLDRIARQHIAAKGYGKYFGHSLGHGVGLEIHEMPRIAPKSKDILEAGNVITIEPGIYLPGRFGVRIEDTVIVTAKGSEVLTRSPKELITIE